MNVRTRVLLAVTTACVMMLVLPDTATATATATAGSRAHLIRRHLTLVASATTVPSGGRFRLSGRVTRTPRGSRVVLQRATTRAWVRVAVARVTRRGTFRVGVTNPGPGTFRYRARVARHGRLAPAVSRSVIVRSPAATSPAPLTGWRVLSTTTSTTCGIRNDGSGWCWGFNGNGAVGNGTTANPSTPYRLPGSWRSLTTTTFDTCGVRLDGTGWCWGSNFYGELGIGTTSVRETAPVQVPGPWTTLVPGADSNLTCGIKPDGTGWCWGYNGSGQVGDGTTTDRSAPVPVSGGATWRALTSNGSTTCGITTTGAAECWGQNNHGQVGDGTTTNRSTPTGLAGSWDSLVLNSSGAVCGTRTDRSGWCWGNGAGGQLGDGSTADTSSPTAISGGYSWRSVTPSTTNTTTSDTTCGIQTDGTGWCWGDDSYGQVGEGTTSPQYVPRRLLSASTTWRSLGSGGSDTCGVQGDGTGWCWGAGSQGAGGNGTTVQQTSPVQVPGAWQRVVTSNGSSCGLDAIGTGYCWGSNSSGTVGDGTTTDRTSPARLTVGGLA